jgi:hypothetical protein
MRGTIAACPQVQMIRAPKQLPRREVQLHNDGVFSRLVLTSGARALGRAAHACRAKIRYRNVSSTWRERSAQGRDARTLRDHITESPL